MEGPQKLSIEEYRRRQLRIAEARRVAIPVVAPIFKSRAGYKKRLLNKKKDVQKIQRENKDKIGSNKFGNSYFSILIAAEKAIYAINKEIKIAAEDRSDTPWEYIREVEQLAYGELVVKERQGGDCNKPDGGQQ